MENYHARLDDTFASLADPTRRAVLARLAKGAAPVKELARPFSIGLPAFMKHLGILERGGLISSVKVGRVRTCQLNAARLRFAETWLSEQRTLWEARADRLQDFVETKMPKDIHDGE